MVETNDLKLHILQTNTSIELMRSSRERVIVGDLSSLNELNEKLDEFKRRLEASIEEISFRSSSLLVDEVAQEYDVDAAAEVFSAIFRDQHPRDVLREHGFDDTELESSELSASGQEESDIDG